MMHAVESKNCKLFLKLQFSRSDEVIFSSHELNFLAERLVEMDSAVADQLEFAIGVAVREQDMKESIAA
jgi:hypothetical protein